MKMKKRIVLRILTCLFLMLITGLVVSCSSIDTENMQYAGATHYAASDPGRVEILRAEPMQPHERIGEVYLDTSSEPQPSVSKVEERLRTEAAKMGADAVVIVYDGLLPTGAYVSGAWWDRGGETTSGRKLVGVAIKYR
jgi:hypothetical protein